MASTYYILLLLVNRGLYYHLPAQSCKEILELGISKLDGKYWIDPEKNGKALKVYCDMTTDGGRVNISAGQALFRTNVHSDIFWVFLSIGEGMLK